MSIRNKIFLPLLLVLLISSGLSAWIAAQAWFGREAMTGAFETSIEATDAASAARESFDRAEATVDQVVAMTRLIPAEEIKTTFKEHSGELGKNIRRLLKTVNSSQMSEVVLRLQRRYIAWERDAEVLLGLKQSSSVPAPEAMARHVHALSGDLDEAIEMARANAKSRMTDAGNAMSSKTITALVVVLLVTIAGAIAAFIIARSLSRPLVLLARDAEKLAQGDTSIEFVGLKRKDEIGATARAIAGFRDGVVERANLAQAAKSDEERRAARQARVENLIEDFRNTATELLGAVDTETTSMIDTAKRLAGIAEDTSEQSASASGASQDAAANVDMVAAAAEELSNSIGNIEGQIKQALEVIESATTGARATNEKVESLAEAATRIGQVVDLIQDIAEQTNLLALNATIEAARAGEAGKGFSVVAQEVKSLANQTAKATDEIAGQISTIQGATGEAVAAIAEISDTMEKVNTYANSIGDSMTEQGRATSEISQNVTEASQRTRTVTENIGTVTTAAGDTKTSADNLANAANSTASRVSRLRETVDTFLKEVAAA